MDRVIYFSDRAWQPRRYDLRAEMDSITSYSRKRASIDLLVPTPLGDCSISRDFFFGLLSHETFWTAPADRIPGAPQCAHCKARARLSHNGAWQLCRNCELKHG